MRVDLRRRSGPARGVPALRTLRAGLTALALTPPAWALAQATGPPAEGATAESLSRIDADYQQQRARLDRERIERLTRLAGSQEGGDAEQTYLEIFRFAIAVDRYTDAEPAADRAIRAGATSREAEFLAQLVKISAEADRGDYDGSMRDLRAFLAAPADRTIPTSRERTRTVLTIGEAYFRRLIRGRKFDLAREVCDLVMEKALDPAVRDHFSGYRQRLDLVGRAAPPIRGVDADGAGVRLDEFRGKVVLVVFWATWCPPCVERLPALNRALGQHERDGFAVLGVNLDSGPDRESLVRRFVIEFGVPWPNVLSGTGERDIAGAFAVQEIPANVLIGRDGRVITFDLGGDDLEEAVAEAVGHPVNPR